MTLNHFESFITKWYDFRCRLHIFPIAPHFITCFHKGYFFSFCRIIFLRCQSETLQITTLLKNCLRTKLSLFRAQILTLLHLMANNEKQRWKIIVFWQLCVIRIRNDQNSFDGSAQKSFGWQCEIIATTTKKNNNKKPTFYHIRNGKIIDFLSWI